jgi:hypothetical protein
MRNYVYIIPLLDLVTSAESLTSLGKVSDKSLRALWSSLLAHHDQQSLTYLLRRRGQKSA